MQELQAIPECGKIHGIEDELRKKARKQRLMYTSESAHVGIVGQASKR